MSAPSASQRRIGFRFGDDVNSSDGLGQELTDLHIGVSIIVAQLGA